MSNENKDEAGVNTGIRHGLLLEVHVSRENYMTTLLVQPTQEANWSNSNWLADTDTRNLGKYEGGERKKRRSNQLRFPCSEVNGGLIVKRLSTGGKRTKERQWWPDAVQLSNALISRLLRKLLRMCRLSPIFRWDWCTAVGLIQKRQTCKQYSNLLQ